jgi:hypothetical protein
MANEPTSEQVDYATLLQAYKAAVEHWIASIREEEALASVEPSVVQIDTWEHAHFAEEEARNHAIDAKKEYEDALRQRLFGF